MKQFDRIFLWIGIGGEHTSANQPHEYIQMHIAGK